MLLRRPADLAVLFRNGRARIGWSQRVLADAVGVSRQWISLVERGKTSVEFDLAVAALQALGYRLYADTSELPDRPGTATFDYPRESTHGPTGRTPLTRHGEPLARQRRKRTKSGPS